mmetsp:Transcript_21632/g.60371  ORF Transcript_21632/g.60371 Transcript_21632/m.60371 type:complete len:278 (+) Transcript_21632:602-1435(+)
MFKGTPSALESAINTENDMVTPIVVQTKIDSFRLTTPWPLAVVLARRILWNRRKSVFRSPLGAPRLSQKLKGHIFATEILANSNVHRAIRHDQLTKHPAAKGKAGEDWLRHARSSQKPIVPLQRRRPSRTPPSRGKFAVREKAWGRGQIGRPAVPRPVVANDGAPRWQGGKRGKLPLLGLHVLRQWLPHLWRDAVQREVRARDDAHRAILPCQRPDGHVHCDNWGVAPAVAIWRVDVQVQVLISLHSTQHEITSSPCAHVPFMSEDFMKDRRYRVEV